MDCSQTFYQDPSYRDRGIAKSTVNWPIYFLLETEIIEQYNNVMMYLVCFSAWNRCKSCLIHENNFQLKLWYPGLFQCSPIKDPLVSWFSEKQTKSHTVLCLFYSMFRPLRENISWHTCTNEILCQEKSKYKLCFLLIISLTQNSTDKYFNTKCSAKKVLWAYEIMLYAHTERPVAYCFKSWAVCLSISLCATFDLHDYNVKLSVYIPWICQELSD